MNYNTFNAWKIIQGKCMYRHFWKHVPLIIRVTFIKSQESVASDLFDNGKIY